MRATAALLCLMLAGACAGGDTEGAHTLAVDDAAVPPATSDVAPPPPPVRDAGPGPDATPPADRCSPEAAEAVVAALGRSMTEAGAPGAAVAIACDGRLVLERGLGTTRAGGAPVTARTRFQLASTTKMLTGALGVALAEDGRVDLDAPIERHVPELGHGALTLHQLLTHTSGYPTEFPRHDPDLLTVVRQNGETRMWSTPGAVWNYSNPGFAVAGAVMQVAAGEPFGPLVERRVLRPAGMIGATFDTRVVLAGEYAPGHSREWPSPIIQPEDAYFHTTYYGPMGGAWGTAGDLARWGLALGARPAALFSAGGFARLLARHTRTTYPGRDYGYGHFVDQGVTPALVSHSGGAPGYVAYLVAVPDAGFAMAAVTHCDWWWPGEVLDEALAGFVELRDDPSSVHPTAEGPHRYVGAYVDPFTFGRVEVSGVAGGLSARFADRGVTAALEPLYGDTFLVDYPPIGEVDFTFWHEAGADAGWMVSPWGVARRAP